MSEASLHNLERYWRDALRPPPRTGVVAWAERNIVLSERITAKPGPFRTVDTPYIREVLEAFADREVESITLCFGPQTGKTTGVKMMAAYAIDYDPGPMLWVLPSAKFAKSFSRGHLLPLLQDCGVLRQHLSGDKADLSVMEVRFDRCTLNLEGAGSPANMASRPVRYLFLDEVDKYRRESEQEASSVRLAIKRTLTFWNRKLVLTSTPTVPTGEIWIAFLAGDQRYYHVPCPHCGAFQRLELRSIIIPPECRAEGGEWDMDAVEAQAWYQCAECRGRIENGHKPAMLQAGKWVPTHPRRRRRSYHLASIYSPWVTFGRLAVAFLEASANPELLHDFMNNEMAEPWVIRGVAAKETEVLARRAEYESGTIPVNGIRHLILTVDVQAYGYWYVLRAWRRGGTSWLIRYGMVESVAGLDEIAGAAYPLPSGAMRVTRVYIDSGFFTKQVYDVCKGRPGWRPIKGSGTNASRTLSLSKLHAERLTLITICVDTYKDALQRKFQIRSGDPGAWYLPADTGADYAQQLCAEEVIEEKTRYGFLRRRWKQTKRDNHLGDCETYQLAAADLLGVGAVQRRKGVA